MLKKKLVGIIVILATMLLLFIVLVRLLTVGRVLPTVSDTVDVRALVQNCSLLIKVYPEKRLPRIGNWDTILQLDVRESDTKNLVISKSNVPTGNNGEALIDLCAEGLILLNKPYDFYVTAESHLRKFFGAIAFDNATGYIDLTSGGRVLLAGDTSVQKNNKINSLDLSTQEAKFYSGDGRNDLNKDGKVNSLDMANTIDNFYLSGD